MLVAPLGKCIFGNASVGLFGVKIRKHFFGMFHGRSKQCSTLATKSAAHLHLLHAPKVVAKDGFEVVSRPATEATVSTPQEKISVEGSIALVILEMDLPQMQHLIQLMGQTEDGELDLHGHSVLAQFEDQLAALQTLHRYKTGNVVLVQFEMVIPSLDAQDVPEDVGKFAIDLSVQEEGSVKLFDQAKSLPQTLYSRFYSQYTENGRGNLGPITSRYIWSRNLQLNLRKGNTE
ncbi:MAG: hypothetical protein L6R42_004893 [Xanthoria sp. 1 TBL-2021]|nr:MAG: hypothetical protein L6R42_004893 [Xanthoria sp. 1 TBL-2021]